MSQTIDQFEAGQRVKVTQQIPQVTQAWTNTITGTVQRYGQKKTGSWYAHAKDDKLWLDRLVIKLDDGEIVTINMDQYTHVEIVPPPEAPKPPEAPEVSQGVTHPIEKKHKPADERSESAGSPLPPEVSPVSSKHKDKVQC